MDQGVLKNTRHKYQKKISWGNSYKDLVKIIIFFFYLLSLTITDAIFFCAKPWDEFSSLSLSHAWNKLGLSQQSYSLDEEWPELWDNFNQLVITEAEKEEWPSINESDTGMQELTDEDNVGMCQNIIIFIWC